MEVDMEMQDAGNPPDVDPLASTESSDLDKEYEVDECLAEKTSKNGKKRYLLKWTGYPIHRASWEPPSLFVHMEEEMLRWQERKRKIAAGLEQPFDVQAWERDVEQWKRETWARKEARRQKRAKREAQNKGENLAPSASHAQSTSRESSPDVPLMQASRESSPDVPLIRATASTGATSRKSHHRSMSTSSDVSSLFVSADEPQPKSLISKGKPPTSTPATALQGSPSLGLPRVQLEPPSSSTSARTVSSTPGGPGPGGPGPQPSQAPVPVSENSQPIQPSQLHISQSADSAEESHLLPEAPKTAISKPDKVSKPGLSRSTGQKASTGTEPSRETQSQQPHASSGQTSKQSALGPLYAAFSSKKISHREPDISQLNLRKPSEFPARTAAGVPVPFATMTSSDIFRRTSHSGTKATSATGSSGSQTTASSGNPRTGPSETRDPPRILRAAEADRPGRSRPLSPRSPRVSFGDHSYRPGDPRRSPPRRSDSRGRSPKPRRRSHGGRSRSPDRQSRSPDRQRSPVSRRRSSDRRRAADTYRPTAPSPFVTVIRPTPRPPVPSTSTRPSPPPATMAHAKTISNFMSENTRELPNNSPSPPHEPPISMKDKINRMPIGQPGHGARFFTGDYFVNPGEVLAHVYFGARRHFVGAVRLCGLSPSTKQDLLAAKGRSSKFEMWFEHSCTKAQYDALCQLEEAAGGFNEVLRTCWMEGFDDSNPEIFHMSEELDANNKVGIYYPPDNHGLVWLAYSPKSPDFGSLTFPSPDISPWIPIRLAVRTPLPPIYALKDSALGEPKGYQQTPTSTMAMVTHGPLKTSVTGVADPISDVVMRLAQTAGTSNPNRPVPAQGPYYSPIQSPMEQRSPVLPLHEEPAWESQQARPTALNQPADPPTDPRIRRLSSTAINTQQAPHGQRRPAEDGSGKITFENVTGATMGKPSDPMGIRSSSTVPAYTALISASQNTSIQGLSNQNSWMLNEVFHRELKMRFRNLASVNGKQDGQQADMFYLHAPDDGEVQNECAILKAWLEMKGAMVWSDWTKFLRNSKRGVILFHESFRRYDVIRPNLRDALCNGSMGFWTFRIARPLDYPDLRYCQQGVHFQRLFNRGGAYLLTEDVLQDPNEALSIVYWFYSILKSNPGQWKLVFWPNLLESLDEKLPNLSKEDQQCLVTLIWLIRKCNSFDPQSPFFDPDSLNSAKLDGPNSNILSLTVAGYGERTAQMSSSLLRDLTQAERNADHLTESFAGWGMENAARLRRFYIISNCKNEALRKRWAGWGHVNFFSVPSFLEKYKNKIGKDVLEKLQSKSKQNKSDSGRSSHSELSNDRNPIDLSSPIQTPQTPMTAGSFGGPTPRDPNADLSNRSGPTEWRQPQPQEGHRHAAPYQ